MLSNKKRLPILILLGIVFTFLTNTQLVYAETDLDEDGILDSVDVDVVVVSNKSLLAGEYYFTNLTITNGATLKVKGDTSTTTEFKGVHINAENLTIDSNSKISADGSGYISGPGDAIGDNGSGYGGEGGYFNSLDGGGPTYGSAIYPIDLGSGNYGARGGGAVKITVSNTFLNNGIVSANGWGDGTSGGSIYVTVSNLSGSGLFRANGRDEKYNGGRGGGGGGGGRIAIYYATSDYAGSAEAKAGSASRRQNNGHDGTTVFIDTLNNDFYIYDNFRFQSNDSTFNYNNINIVSGSVSVEDGVIINANQIRLDGGSMYIRESTVVVPIITLNNGSIRLSGNERSEERRVGKECRSRWSPEH